jgi:hypothetical protein
VKKKTFMPLKKESSTRNTKERNGAERRKLTSAKFFGSFNLYVQRGHIREWELKKRDRRSPTAPEIFFRVSNNF